MYISLAENLSYAHHKSIEGSDETLDKEAYENDQNDMMDKMKKKEDDYKLVTEGIENINNLFKSPLVKD